MFFSPIKHSKEWLKSGLKFGYSTIRLGIDIAIIYGAYQVITSGFKGCKRQDKQSFNIEQQQNPINFYTKNNNTTYYVDRI